MLGSIFAPMQNVENKEGARMKKTILEEIAAQGEMKKALGAIFFAWPNLKHSTLKLMEYMGDILPDSQGDLLFRKCLKSAVNEYSNTPATEAGTEAQMVRFLRGLMVHVPELAGVTVVNKESQQVWEPFDKTLIEFAGGDKDSLELVRSKPFESQDQSLRLMMLARIITTRDLQWIDEHLGLTAVIGD